MGVEMDDEMQMVWAKCLVIMSSIVAVYFVVFR
jgi:hypothetical protein